MLKLDKLQQFSKDPIKANQIAVTHNGAHITWEELANQARKLVAYLGPKKYSRAVFLSANRMELISLMSAFSTLGVPFVGIDYTASHDQMRHCVREVSARCIVYSTELGHHAEALHAELGVDTFCIDRDWANVMTAELPPHTVAPRPFESISFTSGTTGMPKAVYRTASFDARRFEDFKARFGFDSHDVFIATLPFYHVSVVGWARMFLSYGSKVVLSDLRDPDRMYGDLVREHVTAMLATPPVLEALVERASRAAEPSPLKFIVVGGKTFPIELKRRALDTFGPIVAEYYGTTETGVNALATAADLREFPDSSGVVMEGSDIVIVDSSGREVPDGTLGRVVIDSHQNMDGYLNDRRAELIHLSHRRYFVTPDCGYIKNKRLYLASRTFAATTDVNLYALENELRASTGVRDVFSMAQSSGTIQVCVARTSDHDEVLLGEKLDAIARRHVAGKADVNIRFVSNIPYSMSGKVRIFDLLGGSPGLPGLPG
jgi:acyl-CoA synthetase (AMP-forming)/AMP-acid ligase II